MSDRFGSTVHVNVTSYNRQALLTGEVADEKTRTEVEKIVRAVPTVKDVTNDLQVAGIQPGDIQQLVDDLRQTFRLRGDVADERAALLFTEEDVLPEQCLCEAVDRGQWCSQLVRHGRDEFGLHLLDHQVGRDVAEGEDAARDGPERVCHHRLAQRQPDLLATAHDRHEALSRRSLSFRGLQFPLQDLNRRQPERLFLGYAGDLLGSGIPEDHLPIAVDGDDSVGDVGENRNAAFLLERDARIELRVRKRSRGVRGERKQRLDLLGAPPPRPRRIDGEDAAKGSFRTGQRHAEVGRVPGGENGIRGEQPIVVGCVLDRDGRTRLEDVAGQPPRYRHPCPTLR